MSAVRSRESIPQTANNAKSQHGKISSMPATPGHMTVPGQQVTDWLNCGNCTDCFLEPMDHRRRPRANMLWRLPTLNSHKRHLISALGFIGSSDNQRAMAGTGYKQTQRKRTTETFGPPSERHARTAPGDQREPSPTPIPFDPAGVGLGNLRNMERQNSFWLTGGLVAAHSTGRHRDAIWISLKRREVYGTSGDRILLWFDLLQTNGDIPMGSETSSAVNPRFRVSAVGDFAQQPGCPDHALRALGQERLEWLCGNECYNPANERHRIDRVEVVRIQPQITVNEAVGQLIEDPWKTFSCPDDPMGCSIEFEDEDFVPGKRETIYYVRAIQEATPMINADNLRCKYSESGECIEVNPCYGDYRTPADEDCLAPAEQRAWSSPIFVTLKPPQSQQHRNSSSDFKYKTTAWHHRHKHFWFCLHSSPPALWLYLDKDAAQGLKREAEIRSMEVIGAAATKRLAGDAGEETHGSAVDLIKRPIEIREVADNVYYATGVSNTIMISTSEGNVLFDTGLVLQSAMQLRLLKKEVSDAPVRYIVLSHSHADHIGGTRFWVSAETDIIAHQNFKEEQRYLTELQPYQYGRNRTLFPWMPAWEDRPDIAMMRYAASNRPSQWTTGRPTTSPWEIRNFRLWCTWSRGR